MTRGNRGNRGKPRPFRYVLAPEGEAQKTIECPRTVQQLAGAKQAARSRAGDVGAKGTITVEERMDLRAAPWFSWKPVAVCDVVNSEIQRWR